MYSDDTHSSTNRRKFIRSLLGLGVSAPTAALLTQDALADLDLDPKTEVPRLHAYRHINREDAGGGTTPLKREPVFGKISRDKWLEVESARDVANQIEDRLSDLEFEPNVGVRLATRGRTQHREVVITYKTTRSADGEIVEEPEMPFEEFNDLIKKRFPDAMNGVAGRGTDKEEIVSEIPIITKQAELRLQNNYDYEYRNDGVPAGCAVEASSVGPFTLGPPAVTHNTYDDVFVTAAHALTDSNDNPYNSVYQNTYGSSSNKLGDVDESRLDTDDTDGGVIHNLNLGVSQEFAKDNPDSYQGPEITGTRTYTYIDDNLGKSAKKQGIINGREENTVEKLDTYTFHSLHDGDKGDSGGPYWDTDNFGWAYLWGIHKGEFHSYLDSTGNVMEKIEDELNIFV